MSVYDLSLLFPYAGKNNYKENMLLLGVDVDDEEFLKDIENKSKYLGSHGWVVSPYIDTEIGDNLKYIDTWINLINNGNESEIEKYFTDNEYALLRYLFGSTPTEFITFDCYKFTFWYKEATENFFDDRYCSCAIILTAILEGVIRNSPIEKWRRAIIKFYEDSTEKNIRATKITEIDDKFAFIIERYYLLPSVDSFINMFFGLKSENQFGNEGSWEPQYLTRDWLMHGMTERNISKTYCIKLFNALASFLAIKTDMSPA